MMSLDILFPRVKFGTKDRKRGGEGKAIFSQLKIANFTETLDRAPNAVPLWVKKVDSKLTLAIVNF